MTLTAKSIDPIGICAMAPNQVYSWDITYLPSAIRGLIATELSKARTWVDTLTTNGVVSLLRLMDNLG